MVVHRPDVFFARLATDAKIGFGEAYMAGDWDTGLGTDLADLLTPLAKNVATLVPHPLQRDDAEVLAGQLPHQLADDHERPFRPRLQADVGVLPRLLRGRVSRQLSRGEPVRSRQNVS